MHFPWERIQKALENPDSEQMSSILPSYGKVTEKLIAEYTEKHQAEEGSEGHTLEAVWIYEIAILSGSAGIAVVCPTCKKQVGWYTVMMS
ncbi:MAG TPA: hypothetical protein VLA04_04230 [Verrucomicrobiae bacterium]|nr:hypothetical protein [Verrucomicrobiae bacterium]